MFVSHNMGAVQTFCARVLFLDHGELRFDGPVEGAIARYMGSVAGAGNARYHVIDSPSSPPRARAHIAAAEVRSDGKDSADGIRIGAPLEFIVDCVAPAPISRPVLGIGIDNSLGMRIVTLHSKLVATEAETFTFAAGMFQMRCSASELALMPGEYRVKLDLSSANGAQSEETVDPAFSFTIINSDFYGVGGKLPPGVVCCRQQWDIASTDQAPR